MHVIDLVLKSQILKWDYSVILYISRITRKKKTLNEKEEKYKSTEQKNGNVGLTRKAIKLVDENRHDDSGEQACEEN